MKLRPLKPKQVTTPAWHAVNVQETLLHVSQAKLPRSSNGYEDYIFKTVPVSSLLEAKCYLPDTNNSFDSLQDLQTVHHQYTYP